jgi:putative ABC transport system substrate-binding protein
MKRRSLILAALLAPLASRAQTRKSATIGYIAPASETVVAANLHALREGLRQRGYVLGGNLRMEPRYARGQMDRIATFASELANLPADVLVTVGSHVTRVARKVTRDVPIVMAYSGDPVGGGLVDSLARPGGRITGLTTLSPQMAGKRLELLKDTLPKMREVGVVWNPDVPERVIQFKETEVAAARLRIPLQSFPARDVNEIGVALQAASRARVDALIVLNDALLQAHAKEIVELIVAQRLPSLFQERESAQMGALMSYGPSFLDLHRRAAVYVDKILQGAKPGDLPIEQPTRFELVVNARAARALGIAIPSAVLLRADEVIK